MLCESSELTGTPLPSGERVEQVRREARLFRNQIKDLIRKARKEKDPRNKSYKSALQEVIGDYQYAWCFVDSARYGGLVQDLPDWPTKQLNPSPTEVIEKGIEWLDKQLSLSLDCAAPFV